MGNLTIKKTNKKFKEVVKKNIKTSRIILYNKIIPFSMKSSWSIVKERRRIEMKIDFERSATELCLKHVVSVSLNIIPT